MSAVIIDGPTTIQVALDQGGRWLTANHTGTIAAPNLGNVVLDTTKPDITIIYDYKQAIKGALNTIFILEISDVVDYTRFAVRNRKDEDVRIDLICKHGTRPDMIAIAREAERIVETLRSTIGDMTVPSGYNNCFNLMWVLRKRDESDKGDNLHMKVIEIVLQHRGLVLANA